MSNTSECVIQESVELYENSRKDFLNSINKLVESESHLLNEKKQNLSVLESSPIPTIPGKEPKFTDYSLGILAPLWFVVIGGLLGIHCIVWLLKLIFDIPWQTWNWVVTAFIWMLPISICICIIGYIIYRKRNKKWHDLTEKYENSKFKKAIQSLATNDNSLIKLSNDIVNKIHPHVSKITHESVENLMQYLLKYKSIFASERNVIHKELSSLDKYEQIIHNEVSYIQSKTPVKPDDTKLVNEDDEFLIISKGIGSLFIALLVFHFVVWVLKHMFDISWDTWHWVTIGFWIAIPIIAIDVIVTFFNAAIAEDEHQYKLKEYETLKNIPNSLNKVKGKIKSAKKYLNADLTKLTDFEQDVLRVIFNQNIALPINKMSKWNPDSAIETFLKLYEKRNEISTVKDSRERLNQLIDYHNEKLCVFYDHSLESEFNGPQNELEKFVLKSKESQRNDFTHSGTSLNELDSIHNEIETYIDVDKIYDEFSDLTDLDVSGTFLEYDSKKVERKTKALNECVNRFRSQISSFQQVTDIINITLNLVRLAAYRNIYLGAEIINIIRENGGGGKLTTVSDNIDNVIIKGIEIDNISNFTTKDAISDIMNTTINSAINNIGALLDDKKSRKMVMKNPKQAAVIVAGAALIEGINAAMDAWKKRNQKIADCLASQKKAAKSLDELTDTYFNTQANALRIIEIAKAISKANQGFMAIYAPIRDNIFEKRNINAVTMKDLQQLVMAINDYKKISETRL